MSGLPGSGSLYVYVSGPYSPTAEESAGGGADGAIRRNLDAARAIGLALVGKGHVPLVPHTMMEGWEDRHGVDRELALEVCERWVARCDALFFAGSSPGAEREREVAVRLGIPVYRDLEDVPDAHSAAAPAGRLDRTAVDVYLEEYRQAAESYRHTYATIWQAGALIAAAGGLLAASGEPVVRAFAPLPPIAWYLAIFLPMDRYGDLRRTRLEELEELLSSSLPSVRMDHFARFRRVTKKRSPAKRRLGGWRVRHAVTGMVSLLAVLQALLLVRILPALGEWLGGLW